MVRKDKEKGQKLTYGEFRNKIAQKIHNFIDGRMEITKEIIKDTKDMGFPESRIDERDRVAMLADGREIKRLVGKSQYSR